MTFTLRILANETFITVNTPIYFNGLFSSCS